MVKRILIGLLVVLLLTWVYLAFVGVEPLDRRPGTRLSGTLTELPQDWSFVNQMDTAGEVHLETYPWYGVPFSVTTVIAEHNGELVIPSLYSQVMDFPGDKFWNKVVQADPRVRLRVADQLFELSIEPITDADEFQQAFTALSNKYKFWAGKAAEDQSEHKFALLRLKPRS